MQRLSKLTWIGLTGLAVAVSAFAQSGTKEERWIGTWKLNVPKSKNIGNPPPISQIIKVTAVPGGVTVVRDTETNGGPGHTEFTATYDGKEVGVVGDLPGTTVSMTRVDDYTVKMVRKRNGTVANVIDQVVSRDGKTTTATTTLKSGTTGEQYTAVFVYDKQP